MNTTETQRRGERYLAQCPGFHDRLYIVDTGLTPNAGDRVAVQCDDGRTIVKIFSPDMAGVIGVMFPLEHCLKYLFMQTAETPKNEAWTNTRIERMLLQVSSDRLEWLGIKRGEYLGIEKRTPFSGDLLAFWHKGRVRVGRFVPDCDGLCLVEINLTRRGIVRIPVSTFDFIGTACQHFSDFETTL